MEKNRYSNQNLAKGQVSESKKNQDTSSKVPRNSRRREQPNFNGPKAEVYRSKPAPIKTRNYNYDKRPKPRGGFAQPTEFETNDGSFEDYEGARLASDHLAEYELHSVFSPGSKKQSLNHLLNFNYAPRTDQPTSFSKSGNHRSYVRKVKYNKEQFLQANCQFVVRADEDYSSYIASPDMLVEWNKIEQIHILSSEESQCPICLYPPVAGKMTKCGHVYCWPCILHYLALSDKSWRKCPICYDAIHMPDLKSAVSKPYHSFAVGETVTFQLMKREKGSMFVTAADKPNISDYKIPFFNSNGNDNILSKLLLADNAEVLNIIEREYRELEGQINGSVGCPENIFVEQALEQLMLRRSEIKTTNVESTDGNKQLPIVKEQEKISLDCPIDQSHVIGTDYVIDEDSNFTLNDIDIVPTSMCASDYFYFYQAADGQPLYLHSINNRMLQEMYGSLDQSPHKITGKILQKDSCSMSAELRKRLKYLQHLSVSSQFDVVQVELDSVISSDVMDKFRDELSHRRKMRNKRARDERIREKQIFEFNERQLGKSLARSANIQIDSNKQFPTCGSFESFDFGRDPPLISPNAREFASSPGAGPSWSKMLSAIPAASLWPTLPASSSPTVVQPKLVQITGTNMNIHASQLVKPNRPSESEQDEEFDALARAPEFNNNLSRAIEVALEKVNLNGPQSDAATAASTGKKKKIKKTLLFASGMNYN